MRKHLKCFVAVLLAFLLIPVQYVTASSEFQLITATASELFGPGLCEIELLECNDRYYISLDGISMLLGYPYQNKGNQFVFMGQKTDLKAGFTGVGFVEYAGNRWYLLEDALNEVQIYATASKDGDGILYYNSVFTNIDRLLAELDTIMSKDYFSADLLKELGFVGKMANFFANVYDITTNLRLDFFWGNAYSEDIADRIMELLQPIGTEDNLFDKIKSANSKFNKAAKVILKAEDIYEDWREIIYDIPTGGDVLLFGIEGTQYVRDALEASREINKLDVLEFMVEAQLGKSGLKEYKDALKNVGGIDLSGIDT